MARPFRYSPPQLQPNLLVRGRLVSALAARWERRLVVVVGGPGLGKTTLLAQALAENRLDPRGTDVWLGLEPADATADQLAAGLMSALGAGLPQRPVDGAAIAEAVWQRAPDQVALVLDDTHHLGAGGTGAELVAALLAELPSNGHLVVSGRRQPPIGLARLIAAGEVVDIGEDELRFDDDETTRFADARGVDRDTLDGTGGWPALTALAASAQRPVLDDFIWQEVIEPLDPEQRRALAALCELGGADDELAAIALDAPVDLSRALDGVPLIARDAVGWYEPHPLWRAVRLAELGDDERVAIRRRAIVALAERGSFDAAFDLAAGERQWDLAEEVMRRSCLSGARPTRAQLDRWIAACPPAVRAAPAGLLVAGLTQALRGEFAGREPLRRAMDGFRAAGDIAGEVAAIQYLGRIAWWQRDLDLLGLLAPRVTALANLGNPLAAGLDRIGRSVIHDIRGDPDTAEAALDEIEPGWLDPWWTASVLWLRAFYRGITDPAASDLLDQAAELADDVFRWTVDSARADVRWYGGDIDGALADLEEVATGIERTGIAQNIAGVRADLARLYAHIGDAERALVHLARAMACATGAPNVAVRIAAAHAALCLLDADESGATAAMRGVAADVSPTSGGARAAWRDTLVVAYLFVPAARDEVDRAALDPTMERARACARALVASREGTATRKVIDTAIGGVDVGDTTAVRAVVPVPLLVELAVVLDAVGRPEGTALVDQAGRSARAVLRALAAGDGPLAAPAAALAGSVPSPPTVRVGLRVLGGLEILHDDAVVSAPELRRRRVRELLAFLVLNPRCNRDVAMAALWPDLDARAGGNNLRVTLSYLTRALEPWRAEGDAPYLVRSIEGGLTLRVDGLDTDLARLDEHVAAASTAERDGTPSLALPHHLAVVELYRGPLLRGVVDAEWVDLPRERVRTRFVAAGTRAAQLLVASGDPDHGETVATRVIEHDPWCEPAHAALVDAALARGDRSGAHRRLESCLHMLSELGVSPSAEVHALQRRLATDAAGS